QERACCGQRLTVAVGHFNADGDHADALAAPGPQREEKKRHKGDIGEQDDVDPLLLGAGEFGVGTEGGGKEGDGEEEQEERARDDEVENEGDGPQRKTCVGEDGGVPAGGRLRLSSCGDYVRDDS